MPYVSKNVKLVSVATALVALLLAVWRLRVGVDVSTLESPASAARERVVQAPPKLVAQPARPAHVAVVEEPVVEDSPPPRARPAPPAAAETPESPVPVPSTAGLRREFDRTAELELQGIEFPGVDLGDDAVDSAPGLTVHLELHLRTLDAPEPDGVPSATREVRRRYERVSSRWKMGAGEGFEATAEVAGEDFGVSGESPLEGADVVFHWDPGTSAYRASFADGGPRGDPGRIAGLAEDLDLRALAPPPGSGPGSQWTLDVAALDALMQPGGDLQFEYEGGAEDAVIGSTLWPAVQGRAAGAVRGSVQATAQNCERRADRELLSIRIEGQASATWEEGGDVPASIEVELALDGELLWDEEAQRVHSFDVETQLGVALRTRLPDGAEQQVVVRLAGTGTCRFETEELKDG